MHGFFSQKYSKPSDGFELDFRATNNTTKQEEDIKVIRLAMKENELHDEDMEETSVLDNNKDPMNSQGAGKLQEAALRDSKREEQIKINATASNLELIKDVNRRNAEDERSTQHEIDGIFVENSPEKGEGNQFKVEIGHTQRSLHESSGAVRRRYLHFLLG